VRNIVVRIRLTKDASGRTIKTHGANQDITELKRAEEEIRTLIRDLEKRVEERTAQLTALLQEKEALLREVHHRVKKQLPDHFLPPEPPVAVYDRRENALCTKESQTRVRAMALVHEKLYRSEDITRISLESSSSLSDKTCSSSSE
jgi:two-component sensor histidine kinase